ncbi:MAG: MCE family protein [Jatrophihabitantaceae bacterium]
MTRRKLIAAALAVSTLGLSGCGFHGLYSASLPGGADLGSHPYTVNAYFTDVLDLVPQSSVKVNDIAVGKVDSIRLSTSSDKDSGDARTNGWTARVTMSVNSSVQLPANARAEVKMTSLLGEKYVALEEPLTKPSASPLRNNATIPITSTGSAPEVEEVLGALSLLLNGGGLQQIRIITTELNKALKGNTGAVRDLLGQLNTFVGTLDKQKNDITTALDSIDTLVTSLNAQKQSIINALDTFPQALQILRSERTNLVTLLSSLSNLGGVAARVINASQTQLVTALRSLQPSLTQLTAAGSNLPEALKIALTFPFPLGTTRNVVRGDYANLHLFLDISTNELCGLSTNLTKVLPTLCGALAPASAAQTKLSGTGTTQALQPSLLGAGG